MHVSMVSWPKKHVDFVLHTYHICQSVRLCLAAAYFKSHKINTTKKFINQQWASAEVDNDFSKHNCGSAVPTKETIQRESLQIVQEI